MLDTKYGGAGKKGEARHPSWHPGRIKAVEQVARPGDEYGPARYYDVEFDDGDFVAEAVCCVCGGGTASPSSATCVAAGFCLVVSFATDVGKEVLPTGRPGR